MQLEFRSPGGELPLARLLERVRPGVDVAALIEAGHVTVAGLRRVHGDSRISPGSRVCVESEGDASDPAHAASDCWRALVPAVPWQRGEFDASRRLPGGLRFERLATRAGLSELLLRGTQLAPGRLLERLAAFGHPVLGDLRRGGIAVEGGLRLEPAASDGRLLRDRTAWWPEEPALLAAGTPPFLVSAATLRALRKQHPWVLRDSETDDAARFAAGSLVQLQERGGGLTELTARVEDVGQLAARVWSRRGDPSRSGRVGERVAQALERRAALLRPAHSGPAGSSVTDVLRLIHGEADGLPGLSIDRLGPLLRVLLTGRAAESIAGPALDAVLRSLAGLLGLDPPVVEVVHLRDRPAGRLTCVRLLRGALPLEEGSELQPGRLRVRERGISFWVDPGLGQPEKPSPGVGLYLDQRLNRERLARRARHGGRWLNLFAHTGAFSLALLDAGADEVISVDLSARVLRWLEANLELNPRLDASRHRSLRADGRRYLEAPRGAAGELFDGIVIDPPTAAAGGRGYWKLERDLPPLLEAALSRLAPGGTLFVSRNDRRRRQAAGELVEAAAVASGVAIEQLESAPPGPDFPRLRGFPEGDSFDGAIVRRRR